MPYEIVIGRSAERELRALSSEARQRIATRLLALADDPHPMQSIRLRGSEYFRVRVGDYRIIYSVAEPNQMVTVLAIGHRRDVYRDLS